MKNLIVAIKLTALLSVFVIAISCENPAADNKENEVTEIPLPDLGRVIDQNPSWSPDGGKIAFSHVAQEEEIELGLSQIWIIDLETGEKEFVTQGYNPDWSPDGNKLVFNESFGRVSTVKVNGDSLEQLTPDNKSLFSPAWSPRDDYIAMSSTSSDDAGLWIVKTDGSELTHVNYPGGGSPDWSPDGNSIVFGDTLLSIIEIETGETRTLPLHGGYPAWSPVGDRIAFIFYPGPLEAEVWTVGVDGSNPSMIHESGSQSSWSPNGEQIAFHKHWEYDGEMITTLWIVNADGSDPHPLTFP